MNVCWTKRSFMPVLMQRLKSEIGNPGEGPTFAERAFPEPRSIEM